MMRNGEGDCLTQSYVNQHLQYMKNPPPRILSLKGASEIWQHHIIVRGYDSDIPWEDIGYRATNKIKKACPI